MSGTSVITIPHLDRNQKVLAVERWQDVEDIIEHNKLLQTMEQNSDWGRHIGTIPNVILEKWANEEYAKGNVNLRIFTKEFDEIVARKLRDPDWRWLRTDGASSGFMGFGS